MLAKIENYLRALRGAHSDAAILVILADIAVTFGFRSAYAIEYGDDPQKFEHVLDTRPERQAWLERFLGGKSRPSLESLKQRLDGTGPLLYFDSSRFPTLTPELRRECQEFDMVDVAVVPISQEGGLVGVCAFCGAPGLERDQEMSLQVVAYTVFAQSRIIRQDGPAPIRATLTPRERDVIRLSAEGLTSQEIADKLGMSARTANQHVDNVADKLGTKNRAHTVAEAVRHGLLD